MEEIKEIPTQVTYYCTFIRSISPTGSFWQFGAMCDTKEQAALYGSYHDEVKIFEVKLPI